MITMIMFVTVAVHLWHAVISGKVEYVQNVRLHVLIPMKETHVKLVAS